MEEPSPANALPAVIAAPLLEAGQRAAGLQAHALRLDLLLGARARLAAGAPLGPGARDEVHAHVALGGGVVADRRAEPVVAGREDHAGGAHRASLLVLLDGVDDLLDRRADHAVGIGLREAGGDRRALLLAPRW